MEDNETETETEEQETPVSNVSDRKKAEVGHFDGELHLIAFNEGDIVRTLIDKANLSFGDGQSINDGDGNDINSTDRAEDGKTYYIVGNYKQG